MMRKCEHCGVSGLKTESPSRFHYTLSGLDNVYLEGGVTISFCPSCGEKSVAIKKIIELHKVIAMNIALAKRKLSGPELRFLREHMEFSAEDLAKIVEYNEDTIRKIETGGQVPKGPYEMFLRTATLLNLKAPEYDLHAFAEEKTFENSELKFRIKNRNWEFHKTG